MTAKAEAGKFLSSVINNRVLYRQRFGRSNLFHGYRTACYRYRQGKSHNADKKYNGPKHEIRKEFILNFKRYGSRRIKESLKQKGIKVGRRKVAEIMRREGLRAIQPPKFIPRTTDSGHGKRVSLNLLLNQPKPSKPNTAWVSDITYMPLMTAAASILVRVDRSVFTTGGWLAIGW